MIKNVYQSSCKVQYRYCCQILIKLEFSRQIFAKYANIEFLENPVGDELLHADRRTDTTKLIVAFRNFANALNDRLSWMTDFH